ncbi:hypothetical protein FBUS_00059 [Fasciolopsis buskii]|uniref:Uncharacterized protein n=1 Tax=Fasciolopsis buskii TaxID=27845 RepID=A0A8E0RLB9_9TREM|nr:hypothetical protein FBUS_00059 [Fasciolopsis buski]
MVYNPAPGMLVNSDSRLLNPNYVSNENVSTFEGGPSPEMLSMIRQQYAISGPTVTVSASSPYSTNCGPPVTTLPAVTPGSGTMRVPDYRGSEGNPSPIIVNTTLNQSIPIFLPTNVMQTTPNIILNNTNSTSPNIKENNSAIVRTTCDSNSANVVVGVSANPVSIDLNNSSPTKLLHSLSRSIPPGQYRINCDGTMDGIPVHMTPPPTMNSNTSINGGTTTHNNVFYPFAEPNDSNRQTTSLLSSGTALVQNAADYIKLTTNTTKVTVLPMDVVQIID